MDDKLRDRINKCGIKKSKIAQELGISPVTLSRKLHGQNEFKESEIAKLKQILKSSR
jgi:transcriptional regulator with XRE-family HTH domain